MRLAWAYRVSGERQLGRAVAERAFRLRDRVTRRESLYIESYYAMYVQGDRARTHQLLRQIVAEFPKEKDAYFLLGHFAEEDSVARLKQALALDPSYGAALNQLGYAYARRGEYQQALEAFERYVAVNPGDANPYDSMGEMYYFMGKLDDAVAQYKEALDIRSDFGSAFGISYVYALKEDYEEAINWINKMPLHDQFGMGKFAVPSSRAGYEYWTGRTSQSLRDLSAVFDVARAAKNPEWEAGASFLNAGILVDQGHFERGRSAFGDANALSNKAYPALVDYCNAFFGLMQARLYLREGQTKPVETALSLALSTLPKLQGVYRTYLGILHFQVQGELLLAQGKTEEAIRHLTAQVQMPPQEISWGHVLDENFMFSRDGLAKAYVQKGDLDAAIKEYERITTFDPASRERRMIFPLHRYELAKLYEKEGLKEKAITQYERFLTLWKNADAEHHEPKDARARLAKLLSKK